jgi:hypothetical protein
MNVHAETWRLFPITQCGIKDDNLFHKEIMTDVSQVFDK